MNAADRAIDVRRIDHEGETFIALVIDADTVLLSKTQAKHLARLLNSRVDGGRVYSQHKVSETVRAYADQILHDFLPESPELQLGGRILAGELIAHYHRWREASLARRGIPYSYPVANTILGRAMRLAGFQVIRSNGNRYYVGVSPSPSAPSASDERGK